MKDSQNEENKSRVASEVANEILQFLEKYNPQVALNALLGILITMVQKAQYSKEDFLENMQTAWDLYLNQNNENEENENK